MIIKLQVIGAIEDFDRAIEQLGDAVTAPLLFERARAMLSLQEPAMVRGWEHLICAHVVWSNSQCLPLSRRRV
jgi:hypothetical protein